MRRCVPLFYMLYAASGIVLSNHTAKVRHFFEFCKCFVKCFRTDEEKLHVMTDDK